MSRVLVIGDIHAPLTHPKYLAFCKKIKKKHRCTEVVFIGDIVDHHVISFHDKHPEAPAVKQEYEDTLKEVAKWYKAFPKAEVLIGNHDERHLRIGKKNQIPELYFKSYNELFETPGWEWTQTLTKDGVYYHHGHGIASSSSVLPAATVAMKTGRSSVLGHFHSRAGTVTFNVDGSNVFGLQVGCGVDNSHPAMDYSKSLYKNIISCGVVLNGESAYLEVMDE